MPLMDKGACTPEGFFRFSRILALSYRDTHVSQNAAA